MAQTATRATLRTGARQRADMEDTTFVSDAELNTWIEDARSELHDLLVTQYEDFYANIDTITLVNGQENYALPTDYYKTLAMFYISGGLRYELERFNLHELADYANDRVPLLASGEHLLYRIIGNEVYFEPKPADASTVEHWYVPHVTALTDDVTTLALPIVPGWQECIEVAVAIEMKSKEEADTSYLERKLAQLRQRIVNSAAVRDAGKPQRVRDVYGHSLYRSRRRRYPGS